MTDEILHIAIDGPSASGKGSVARELSRRLGIPALDTGAMYRGLAVHLTNNNIDEDNEPAVNEALQKSNMNVDIRDGITYITIDGIDTTPFMRSKEISIIATKLAAFHCVKLHLTKIMQDIAGTSSFILEGRDITSVVLPNAKYKFFITASAEARAKRRHADYGNQSLDDVIKQIDLRDEMDATREWGKLIQTPDSILIDSSNMTLDETVDKIMSFIN